MALYVIGDTHFSELGNKPMDVFEGKWTNYREKLIDGFESTLTEKDLLVLCGDFSWGMNLEEALPDFRLLASFPGKKLLLKGNHDYWWTTLSKMRNFLESNSINNVDFLHNNCHVYENRIICGSRGWYNEDCEQKIFNRELIRLEASLKAAGEEREGMEILCFLHYPPFDKDERTSPLTKLIRSYGVRRCFYGHLHGQSIKNAFSGELDGVHYSLISADAIGFRPVLID